MNMEIIDWVVLALINLVLFPAFLLGLHNDKRS